MSDRLKGWFAVERKSIEHPFFKRSERSEYEAWLWLIAHAAWEETHHWVNGKRHDVNRGELFTTLRELQSAWMWSSDKKVRGFIKRLSDERMIDAETSHGKTQITICNYSLYQDIGRKKDAETSEKSPSKGQAKDAIKEQTKQINNISSSFHSEDNTNPISLPEPKIPPRKKASPKTLISETWEPDQGCIDKAYSVGMDRTIIEVEAENFRNHHFNKQSKMVSWSLAWGTWCNNWKKFQANKPQSFKAKNKPSEFDILDELADRIEAQGAIQ
jgi:hypothetical protein